MVIQAGTHRNCCGHRFCSQICDDLSLACKIVIHYVRAIDPLQQIVRNCCSCSSCWTNKNKCMMQKKERYKVGKTAKFFPKKFGSKETNSRRDILKVGPTIRGRQNIEEEDRWAGRERGVKKTLWLSVQPLHLCCLPTSLTSLGRRVRRGCSQRFIASILDVW